MKQMPSLARSLARLLVVPAMLSAPLAAVWLAQPAAAQAPAPASGNAGTPNGKAAGSAGKDATASKAAGPSGNGAATGKTANGGGSTAGSSGSTAGADREAAAASPAGAQVVMAGAPPSVPACSSCHGVHGEGNPAANAPRLAGQSRDYLAHQIDSYADGSRNNPIMTPIAKGLSREQRAAVVDYYASVGSAPETKRASGANGNLQRGKQLATLGDSKLRVQACVNCHGPDGTGEQPTYPFISGQTPAFLVSALKAWKDGSRHNDPSGQMSAIGEALSENDIQAVAHYFSQLPAPAPLVQQEAARGAARPIAAQKTDPARAAAARAESESSDKPQSSSTGSR